MMFHRTIVPGACVVELEKRADERGFFARGWCRQEFADEGLCDRFVQMNISFNRHRHTLRGFHYQVAPHREDKLLRCVRGALHDVMIDLRPHSPTYMRHIAVELNATNYLALLVPKGCANAFLTLDDHTEANYLVSEILCSGRRTRRKVERPCVRHLLALGARHHLGKRPKLA